MENDINNAVAPRSETVPGVPEQRAYVPGDMPAPAPKHVYDRMERLLVPVALAIGLLIRLCFSPSCDYRVYYTMVWAVYALGFFMARRGRPVSRVSWAPLIAAALLLARMFVYTDGRFDSHGSLNVSNYVIAPFLLMLHWALSELTPADGGWDIVKRWLTGWFVAPFTALWRIFPATGSVFSGKRTGEQRRAALLGAAIGVPLFVIVAALLINADGVMKLVFWQAFENADVGVVISYIVWTAVFAMFFYSFLYNTKNMPAVRPAKEPALPALTGKMVIVMLLVAYAVFAGFQFTYLTGLRGLPEELTYSEYAVSGFNELLAVTAINLVLYVFVRPAAENDRAVRGLCFGLLLASAAVLYSALVRLMMYIGAYAFTISRLLALWFMIYLTFALVLCAIRLVRRFSAVRFAMLGLIVWYALLNLLPLHLIFGC